MCDGKNNGWMILERRGKQIVVVLASMQSRDKQDVVAVVQLVGLFAF